MVEAILAGVGDVDIGPAVVVVVGHGYAESPALVGDAGLVGDVGEGAVVIVVEEHGSEGGLLALHGRGGGGLWKGEVEPAVAGLIEEGDAPAGGFELRGI